MTLSRIVIKELRRELADLNRKRNEIDASISGLESILALSGGQRATEAVDTITPEMSITPHKRFGKRKAGRKRRSLREIVSRIVHHTPGLTPRAVARALEQTGFSVRGKTALHDRVYHELRRLKQKGLLQRDANGGYLLVEAQSARESGAPRSEASPVPS